MEKIQITLNKYEIELILDSLDNEISIYNKYDGDKLDDVDMVKYRDILIALADKINKDYQKILLTTREKLELSLTNPDFLEIV